MTKQTNMVPIVTNDKMPHRPVDVARHCIERVMAAYPALTTNGCGFGRLVGPADYNSAFLEYRASMLSEDSCRQFDLAVAWLERYCRTKAVNRRQTSYGLKHEVEAWVNIAYPNEKSLCEQWHVHRRRNSPWLHHFQSQ